MLLIRPRKTQFVKRRDMGFSDIIFVFIPKFLYRISKIIWDDYGPVFGVIIAGFIGGAIYLALIGKVQDIAALWEYLRKYWHSIVIYLLVAFMLLRALLTTKTSRTRKMRKMLDE